MADALSDYKAHQPAVILLGGAKNGELLSEAELTEEALAGYKRTGDTDEHVAYGPRGGKKEFTVRVWEWVA